MIFPWFFLMLTLIARFTVLLIRFSLHGAFPNTSMLALLHQRDRDLFFFISLNELKEGEDGSLEDGVCF